MPKTGQILTLTSASLGSVQGLVLRVEPKSKLMLVALVSVANDNNLPRIQIAKGLFAYPSIQGTVWFRIPNSVQKVEDSNLNGSIENLIYVWPALTSQEKKLRSQGLGSEIVQFGDTNKVSSEQILKEIGVLRSLSLRFIRSSRLPAQLSPKLLADNLCSSKTMLPLSVLAESHLAFFAGGSLAEPMFTHLETVGLEHDIYRRMLIRKFANIRATNNSLGSSKNRDFFAIAVDFMERSGLDFIEVLGDEQDAKVLKSNSSPAYSSVITVRSKAN
jgi:hypothetical protein